MNLTTPPPVEELDPDYAADLKHDLVRRARKRKQTERTPYGGWASIVATATAIAVIITGVVVLSRSGGSTGPAGSAGVLQVAPDDTQRDWIEIGEASDAEARAAARECLTPRKNAYGNENHLAKASDAATATIRSARWIKASGVPGKDKQLLQTLVTKNDNFWFQCLDGELLRWEGYFDGFGKGLGSDGSSPVPGTWGWSDIGDGMRATYSFRAGDEVDLVELRIRGVNGVSPWYAEHVADHGGYLAGTLSGAAAEHGEAEIDVRAFDKAGQQIWFTTFG